MRRSKTKTSWGEVILWVNASAGEGRRLHLPGCPTAVMAARQCAAKYYQSQHATRPNMADRKCSRKTTCPSSRLEDYSSQYAVTFRQVWPSRGVAQSVAVTSLLPSAPRSAAAPGLWREQLPTQGLPGASARSSAHASGRGARAQPHCACVLRPIGERAFRAQQCACVPLRETAARLRGSRAERAVVLRMRSAVGGKRPCAEPRALRLRGGRCLAPLRAAEGSAGAELCGETKSFVSLRLLGSALTDSQERSRPKVNVILLSISSGCSGGGSGVIAGDLNIPAWYV